MRVWDLDPKLLCRKHLLGEHREMHAIWNILTQGKKGYRKHPETKRWVGKLKALYKRHQLILKEMQRRGYQEASPMDPKLATGSATQDEFVDSIEDQLKILKNKDCDCPLA